MLEKGRGRRGVDGDDGRGTAQDGDGFDVPL